MDWREVKLKFWRSVDVFGVEGSPEKESAIRTQTLGSHIRPLKLEGDRRMVKEA